MAGFNLITEVASTVQLHGDHLVCEFQGSAHCSIFEGLGSELEYTAQ
jgi:hypothetical protein